LLNNKDNIISRKHSGGIYPGSLEGTLSVPAYTRTRERLEKEYESIFPVTKCL